MHAPVAYNSGLLSVPQNSVLVFLFPQELYDLSGKDSMDQDWKCSFPSSTAMADSTSEHMLFLGFNLVKHLSFELSLCQVRKRLDSRVKPPLGLLVLST
jgi:hypothetical protein